MYNSVVDNFRQFPNRILSFILYLPNIRASFAGVNGVGRNETG